MKNAWLMQIDILTGNYFEIKRSVIEIDKLMEKCNHSFEQIY